MLGANETVVKGAGTVSLYAAGTLSDTLVENINVSSSQITVSGTGVNTQININPTADLVKDQAYYVKVSAGALVDLAGNSWAGITDSTSWNFTGAGATVLIGAVATDNTVNLAESLAAINVTGTLGAEASVLGAYTAADMTAVLHPTSGADISLNGLSYSYTSGSTGTWNAVIPQSAALSGTGDYALAVTFTGASGTLAAGVIGVGTKTVHVDTVVAAPSPTLATNSGSDADSLTNVGTVNVAGLEGGATWQYSTDAGANWTLGSGSSVTLSVDGSKSITVRQTDAAGNASTASSALTFTLDGTAPSAPATSLATNSGSGSDSITNVGTLNVTGLESGATWQYSTDAGANWTTGSGSSFTLTGDGAKSVSLRQTDVAGNTSAASSAFAFTLDTAATMPTASLATNSGSGSDSITNAGTLNVTGLESGATWQYSLNAGTNWTTGSGSFVTLSGDGTKSVTLRQTDVAGNTSAASSALAFTLDTAAAAPTISLATDSGNGSDSITNVGTANVAGLESGATWEYSLNAGTSWTAGSGSSVTLSGDTAKSVIVRQTDVAGNTSTASSALAFTLDTAGPSVTMGTPTFNSTTGATTLGFTFSEAMTGFDATDVTVVNGSKGAFTTTDASHYSLAITPTSTTTPQALTLNVATGVATDVAGNANTAAAQFLTSVLYGTSGTDTLTVGSAMDHIFLGGGNDVIKFASAAGSTVASTDNVMDVFGAGDKIDLSTLLGTGGSGYTGTALGDSGAGFVEIKNLTLAPSGSNTLVQFNIHFDAATIGSSKVTGAVIDLAYTYSAVSNSQTVLPTFSYSDGFGGTATANVWSQIQSNLSVLSSVPGNGKIAVIADTSSDNTIIDSNSNVMQVRLLISGSVSTFGVGLESRANGGDTYITTADGLTHNVDVGVTKTAGVTIGATGTLEIITDTNTLSPVGDNQLHMVTTYDNTNGANVTHLQVQYDTNSTFGATLLSSIIALDFDGDVRANLTPASLTYI